ncbi:MAG: Transporter [Succiniclasticum sp.]|jgi:neurotransmitter:Na+ symporter, NSS family
MGTNTFSSRLGFILVSAGCAIGLGNVWRFPFITGKYGGASFVVLYLIFLALLGLPIMVAEFAVGRSSIHSPAKAFNVLEPKGTYWHKYKYVMIAGNVLLMMYYTTISGWMFYYFYKMLVGAFEGMTPAQVGSVLGGLLQDPQTMVALLLFVILLGFFVCYLGVQAGVERITKVIMSLLLVLIFILAVNSVLLPGSEAGLRYYLYPDFSRLSQYSWNEVIFNAMGQAFFTLSIGQGSLSIFGSYIGKEKRLTGEAVWIIVLDTFVALMAGLIIFPACFSYGINPGAGPNLLFVTLPNVFNHMFLGRFWGTLFFLFMIFASMSTVIAIFEFITGCFMELTGLDRKTIIKRAIPIMFVLSLPCTLGFNVWSSIQPFGPGSSILDLEDFIVSNNLLPLGSIVYMTFCTSRYGWGWKNFLKEVDTGKGLRFPKCLRFYVTYILPLIVLYIMVNGYIATFGH